MQSDQGQHEDFLSPSADILRSLDDYADITSWVNDIIEGNEYEEIPGASDRVYDLSELEKRVSHISAVLEVACEDTSAQLEKTIDVITRTVPRLSYDLQLMQESALSLQVALQAVELHSHSSLHSEETGHVLEELNFLDTVKSNMDASLAVLREAEAWSSLESEVVSFLAEQSYSKAAARLSEASKSLSVFQNTPEFESRKTLMINLQNQLEASLSSALVAGININDVDACKRYFNIFCHIEREAEFRSYWNGSKRKGLISLWQGAELQDCDVAAAESSKAARIKFATFLKEFYEELLSVLQLERVSVVSIFPDPQSTLSTFVTSTLTSLHPSASQRLNGLIHHYGDLVLPELISAFKATEEFAVSTDKIMEKVGYSSLSPSVLSTSLDEHDGPPLQRTHSRRHSQRQSFSRRLNRSSISGTAITGAAIGTLSLDRSWDEALFEPFLEYQCDYATLEKRLLRAQLSSSLTTHSASSTGARLLRERAVDILAAADDGLARCMAFTHGYGAVGLIQALDDLVDAFFDASARDILDSARAAAPSDSRAFASGEEFAELDYSAADLETFQLVLHLLEATRSILERLSVFEAKLRASLVQTANALRMARNDPFGVYVSGATKGELGLLQGSSLNSIELQTLLDSVDTEQQHHSYIHTPYMPHTPGSASLVGQKSQGAQYRGTLLVGARAAVINFARTCQIRLQETILAPLLKHLATYPSLPSWSTPENSGDRRGVGGSGTSELVIPTFSLSPSVNIQRVAEGLLSLPRLFEVYADDDALAFSIETLPFVDEESLKAMAGEGGLAVDPTEDDGRRSDTLDQPRSRPARHLSSPSLSVKVLPPSQLTPTPLILTPEAVASAWLASLALTLLSHLTSKVLPAIPSLSAGGAAQLAEDLGYLSQIVKALNVEWEALENWREVVGLDEEEVRRRLEAISDVKSNERETLFNTLKIVTKLRGWSI